MDEEDFHVDSSDAEDNDGDAWSVGGDDDDDEDDFAEEVSPPKKPRSAPTPAAAKPKSAPKPASKPKPSPAPAARAKPAAAGATPSAGVKRAKPAAATPATAPSAKGGTSKAKKPSPVSEKAAGPHILEYMTQQNRPYSSTNVYDNLHGAVKKAHVGRVMDRLVEDGKLSCKVYGKSKVYFVPQDQYGEAKQEELDAMDAQTKQRNEELRELKAAVGALESKVRGMGTSMRTDELRAAVAELTTKRDALRKRLDGITADGGKVSPEARKKLLKKFNAMRKEWSSRKNTCMDFLGNMAEGLNKKLPKLMDELGIEGDEGAGVSLRDVKVQ